MKITSSRSRKDYIVFLRAIATVAVVFYHCGAGGSEYLDNFVKLIFNWCVPIFIMITGALFLDSKKELTVKKIICETLPKFLGILAIWGGIYNLLSLFIIEGPSVASAAKAVLMVIKGDTTYCYQFWYLYFIVGMYILLPIIKPWVDKNMNGEKPPFEVNLAFGFVLAVGIVAPTAFKIVDYFGSFWHGAFTVYSGLSFYLLCGCWLSKWSLTARMRIVLAVTWGIQFAWLLINAIRGSFENVVNLMGYQSFFTWEMSILLFDAFRRLDYSRWNAGIVCAVRRIADDSLGVYIFHVMILWLLGKICPFDDLFGAAGAMFLSVVIAIVVCMIGTEIAKKIPGIHNLV